LKAHFLHFQANLVGRLLKEGCAEKKKKMRVKGYFYFAYGGVGRKYGGVRRSIIVFHGLQFVLWALGPKSCDRF